ncbi:MAG: pyruvate, phosphate dikinase, partial [Deltaproteobacteria bacterium]|nr:pyruvate, phosphate dikinase [Deltaproteobacteria bacterium]
YPGDWGTACNVQAMVYGNMGETSGTGVAFTRNPSTGEKKVYGEYLFNAQGEDIVAGTRTPISLDELNRKMPECYKELMRIFENLENSYRDMQDMEFTIQKGKVWMLQTRNGKRTALAAVKVAVDMVDEGLIKKEEALLRVNPEQIENLLHPMIDPKEKGESLGKGLPGSPGAAVGRVVFTADDAVAMAEKKEPVVLVREETSPEDIHGMNVAQGILTSRGGLTSHAAVVARGMGKVCVVGLGALQVDEKKKEFRLGGKTAKEGDWITVDGTTGNVYLEKLKTIPPQFSDEFHTLMSWADKIRTLKVRTNADTPKDVQQARDFGAEGIGLCRTEHMFFDEARIQAFREMILADSVEARRTALAKIQPMQRGDFEAIFRIMKGLPVTIRLLDPPLHEFLPHGEEEIQLLAKELKVSVEKLHQKINDLREMNPMLGHRGCRLGIVYPEVYEMQVQAIMEAACMLKKKEKIEVEPEIEIPLVGLETEIKMMRRLCEETCQRVLKETGVTVSYKIGTMIEIPRAALESDRIAPHVDFMSFGTNDLTQTTFGISRDDGFKFLPFYQKEGLIAVDPFQTLDQEGVGKLMKICVEQARKVKPKLEIGICGEHGGDPSSVEYCHRIGLDYVSCSPFRVPVARLAAAQAVLKK